MGGKQGEKLIQIRTYEKEINTQRAKDLLEDLELYHMLRKEGMRMSEDTYGRLVGDFNHALILASDLNINEPYNKDDDGYGIMYDFTIGNMLRHMNLK